MRQFRIPGQETQKAGVGGFDKREKRKLLFMVLGLVLVIVALIYSTFRGKSYEDAQFADLPSDDVTMVEKVDLPHFDPQAFDQLVRDAEPVDRVVLEGKALDAILPKVRKLTPRHFEVMGARELDKDVALEIEAAPSAHRLQPFTARGFIDSVRTRRRGDSNDVEHIGRLILDDSSVAYFVVLDAPESAGYVRIDGLFMKVFSEEDDLKPGEWREGPLLVGPAAIRSYRALGKVDEPNFKLWDTVQDARLVTENGEEPRIVRDTPAEPLWNMMAYARDLAPDAIDWDKAPELDAKLMNQLLEDPQRWRGQPIRIPICRVQDGRIVTAGENPARIERYTQGWLGSWNWPNVVRFRYPEPVTNIRLRDFAFGKGFFLQNFAYESQGKGLRVAPLIVLADMTRFESRPDPIFHELGDVFAALAVGMIALFTFLLVRDKKRSKQLQAELTRRRRARRDRGHVSTTSPS